MKISPLFNAQNIRLQQRCESILDTLLMKKNFHRDRTETGEKLPF